MEDKSTAHIRHIERTVRVSAIGLFLAASVWLLRDILLLTFSAVVIACVWTRSESFCKPLTSWAASSTGLRTFGPRSRTGVSARRVVADGLVAVHGRCGDLRARGRKVLRPLQMLLQYGQGGLSPRPQICTPSAAVCKLLKDPDCLPVSVDLGLAVLSLEFVALELLKLRAPLPMLLIQLRGGPQIRNLRGNALQVITQVRVIGGDHGCELFIRGRACSLLNRSSHLDLHHIDHCGLVDELLRIPGKRAVLRLHRCAGRALDQAPRIILCYRKKRGGHQRRESKSNRSHCKNPPSNGRARLHAP